MLDTAVVRLEGKLWWSNIAVGILPGPFTLSEARRVYEAVAQTRYDPATFGARPQGDRPDRADRRQRATGPGRPAAMYRFASDRPAWGAGRRKRIAAA